MDGDKLGIIVLLVGLLGSLIPAFIASSKGRSFFLWYIYGFFLFPFAFIHAIVIKPNEQAAGMTKCPSCTSVISKDAKVCPSCRTRLDGSEVELTNATLLRQQQEPNFDGERNVSSSSYQLFLTKRFGIEKNATLEKYVIGNDIFDTLVDSLREADTRYANKLNEDFERQELVRRELNARDEQMALERAKKSENEARDCIAFLENEARLAPIKAKKFRLLTITIAIISIFAIFGPASYQSISKYYDNLTLENKIKDNIIADESRKVSEKNEKNFYLKKQTEFSKLHFAFLDKFSKTFVLNFEIGAANMNILRTKIDTLDVHKNYRDYDVTISGDAIKKFVTDANSLPIISSISFRYCTTKDGVIDSNNMDQYFLLTGVSFKVKDTYDAKLFEDYLRANFEDTSNNSPTKTLTSVIHINVDDLGVGIYRKAQDKTGTTLKDACGNKWTGS